MPARLATRRPVSWTLAAACIIGCSFQDFDYLQQGTTGGLGGSSSGSGGGGNIDSGGSSTNNTGAAGDPGTTTGSGGSAGDGSVGGSGAVEGSTASGGTSSATTTSAATGGSSSGGSSTTSTTDTGAGGEAGSPPTNDNDVLVNGSFEEGWTGWLVDPAASQGNHARVKWPQPGSTTPDGEAEENLLGTWHETEAYAIDVYQSLSGLEDGLYTFKGYFNWGGLHNALQVFARNCGGTDLIQDIPPTGDTQWLEVGIGGIEVIGGNCEVGFTVDSNAGDWMNADLFSFEMDPQ